MLNQMNFIKSKTW